jgi:tetratricopeptide (TPR) repeat protein
MCDFRRSPVQFILHVRRTRRLIFALSILLSLSNSSLAQLGGTQAVPGPQYYASFPAYYEGDYQDALRIFRAAARTGVVSIQGRWVDAICYHTMVGECYYHLGDLAAALEQYDSAVRVFLSQQGWLLRVKFPPQISPHGVRTPRITWGSSNRRSILGKIPGKMLSLQGRFDNERVAQQGGVIALPKMEPLGVPEILRCMALATRRRTELMGPASRHDKMTAQLVQALEVRPVQANHWSQGWIDALLGVAYASIGKDDQAQTHLTRAIVLAGQYDHILTPTVLLELGKLAFEHQQYELATNYFLEATYIAEAFDQADVMSEAFHKGALCFFVTEQNGIYPPLSPAIAWAKRHDFHALQASLLILAAENFVRIGDTRSATTLLREANRVIARRDMRVGRIAARLQYQLAVTQFASQNGSKGNVALQAALTLQQQSSLRIFQVALIDKFFLDGAVTPRVSADLFKKVLREPTVADWKLDPLDTLTLSVSPPNFSAWTHWYQIAQDNKQHGQALEIADRIRRRRFYASLPWGGRLLALRWVLEAPAERLSEKAQLQRQDLMVRHPDYQQLSEVAAQQRAKIEQTALDPTSAEDGAKLKKQFEGLARTSSKQELMLRNLAVRREPSEFAFPPLKSTTAIQQKLKDGQVVLAFFSVGNQLDAYSMSKEKYTRWTIKSPPKVRRLTANLLRQMGNFDKNGQLTIDQLSDEKWKQTAAKLLKVLIPGVSENVWDDYKELIIVPDDFLWYLPFEALQVEQGDELRSLISKVRIRYVPTLSLAHPLDGAPRPVRNFAVLSGKLDGREQDELGAQVAEEIMTASRGAFQVDPANSIPSRYSAPFWEQLLILRDIDTQKQLPYDWAPVHKDRVKSNNTLRSWFKLPWGAPERVIMPGYHTAAEDAFKRQRRADGSEVFLTVCGMMSTGTRTILLSRWRTGGQTAYDLVREFVQELPFTSASDAWQRSVQLTMHNEIDPSVEPRIRWKQGEELSSDHSAFFWAGPMLVDTGREIPVQNDRPNGDL